MKGLWKKLIFTCACALLLVGMKPAQANAETYFTAKSSVNSKYQITLKWKKQSCSQIRIYRERVLSGGSTKPQLIKTLKGSATTYTDKKAKKNNRYSYTVKAYKKVKGKYVLKSVGVTTNYAGLAAPTYKEYSWAEGEFGPTNIKLVWNLGEGMAQTGYQIQRKEGTGSYKTVKTLKTTKRSNVTWNNTGLTALKEYSYRIRAYKKIGKKTVYGKWSDKFTRITSTYFKTSGFLKGSDFTCPSTRTGEFKFSMTSACATNALLNLSGDFDYAEIWTTYPLGTEENTINLTKVMVNGVQTDKDSIKLNPNDTVTVYFTQPYLYDYLQAHSASDTHIVFAANYSGIPLTILYDISDNSVTAKLNDEAVH